MKNGLVIFVGVLLIMLWSWYGFIEKNFVDLSLLKPAALPEGGAYPAGRTGTAHLGEDVYQANGCASCHTMQVRMKGYGADIERGWGRRNSVLEDYLLDQHVFLGEMRVGPDLADAGTRNPDFHTQLLHLYNPRITSPDSMMPQYKFLFEKHKVRGRGNRNALRLPEKYREAGYEIIPTREATALAEYLVSLHAQKPIFEAPLLPKPQPSAATNQPTNATATAINASKSNAAATTPNLRK